MTLARNCSSCGTKQIAPADTCHRCGVDQRAAMLTECDVLLSAIQDGKLPTAPWLFNAFKTVENRTESLRKALAMRDFEIRLRAGAGDFWRRVNREQ